MRLLLVRHGESTWNREHRIQGQLDPPLSPGGIEQAQRLAERLRGHQFAGFYCSDLERAAQTARAIAPAIALEPVHDPGLREVFLGEWEGLLASELAERFPEAWRKWSEEPDWDLVPGGESGAAFEARVAAALHAIWARHASGDILAVTHGGVIQVALHGVVGRPSRGLFPFKIQNTSISVIEKRGENLVVAGVNDTCHLEAKA